MVVSDDAVNALLNGDHGAPFDLLGPHQIGTDQVSIRAFNPEARALEVVDEQSAGRTPMARVRNEGFFEVTVAGQWPGLCYHFDVMTHDGEQESHADPYAFP